MISVYMTIFAGERRRTLWRNFRMNRLLGLVARSAIACLWLGACAKQGVDPYSFQAALPDSSVGVANGDDGGGLGVGESGTITLLPPIENLDGSIVISVTGDEGGVGANPEAGAPNSLVFVPPMASVTIDGTGSKSTSFSLEADFGNGLVVVTADAVEFDRPDLATATAAEPVVATAPAVASPTPYGGSGVIHAIYHGVEAKATLNVVVNLTQYGTGITATSPGVAALGGANLAADPAPMISPILYPYDGTVWPLGLVSPLTMWNGPSATDVYRLHYAEKYYAVDYYTGLAQVPAQARLDQTSWDRMTNSNDSLHGGTDPVTFTLSRWDSTANVAYTSATETWTVAPESLRGTIYYWSASETSQIGKIVQFNPGPGAMPQVLNTTGGCAGCHAVNAQGTVLMADIDDKAVAPSAAPLNDPYTGSRAWASFDLTQANTPTTYQSTDFGGDMALTPDGKLLVFGGPRGVPGSKYLSLGTPTSGTVITTSGLDSVVLDANETNLEMPAFSPDGTKLVLLEAANAGPPPGDRGASDNVLGSATGLPSIIAYLNFTEATPSFDPTLHKITSSADPAFAAAPGLAYPSFTPDSTAVAFHAGTTPTGCNAGCPSDNEPDDGNLFIATLASGTPIRLAKASDPPDPADLNTSVEPTFNPVVRGGYSWMVFTSMRKWGNQPWPAGVTITTPIDGKRRLWLAPVDTTIGTTDPSHPAIYLEGQDFTTPNMRAFYTLNKCIPSAGMTAAAGSPPVGTACVNGFDCCSGFCQNAMCIEPSQSACVGLGGTCTTSGQCCNAPTVQCIDMICQVPITH
jgi:hypothetical protein